VSKPEHDRAYRERLREAKRAKGTLKPQGGQSGNTNKFQHGAYSLLAIRTKGSRPNGNTKLGRAFRAREREYLLDIGGEENASLAERQIANDNTWCDFLIATMDCQLENKRQLVRKGKPHPLIDLRMRIAAHRRENYKLIGIKRVVKPLTLQDLLEQGNDNESGQPDNASEGVDEGQAR
jgi:hypothetical protein